MLKLLGLSTTVLLAAASAYFSVRAIRNGFRALLRYHDWAADGLLHSARCGTGFMNLCAATAFLAGCSPLHELGLLVILPLFPALVWLD